MDCSTLRSRTDVPDASGKCILAPAFGRIRFNPAHVSEIILPLSSVRPEPHTIFFTLKSLRRIKRGGNYCEKSCVRLP